MRTEGQISHRDLRLDILRGIGLICIVLAHVSPPKYIFQLRNFDVPLMVMVAGAAFSLSKTHHKGFAEYLVMRFERLVVPTWIFLGLFFLFALPASLFLNKKYPFSLDNMLGSFVLMNGIDYVWVIRVFVLVAIIAPAVMKFTDHSRQRVAWLVLCLIYIVYELVILYLPVPDSSWVRLLLQECVFYLVPYGIVAAIGMRMYTLNTRQRLWLAIFAMLISCLLFLYLYTITGKMVPSQIYKYPPRIYYLSYAIGVSLLLSSLIEIIRLYSIWPGHVLSWLGQRTMWTYLWHILFLYLFDWLNYKPYFVLKFVMVFGASISMVMIQNRILNYLLRFVDSRRARRRLALILSG